jgi:hypothetical protein
MATAKKARSWLASFTGYLSVVMVIADQVSAGRGSDELRQVAREAVRVTDEWANLAPSASALDPHNEVFLTLMLEAAKRANLEWPQPTGYAGWGAVFAELVRQADKAREGQA